MGRVPGAEPKEPTTDLSVATRWRCGSQFRGLGVLPDTSSEDRGQGRDSWGMRPIKSEPPCSGPDPQARKGVVEDALPRFPTESLSPSSLRQVPAWRPRQGEPGHRGSAATLSALGSPASPPSWPPPPQLRPRPAGPASPVLFTFTINYCKRKHQTRSLRYKASSYFKSQPSSFFM